MTSRSGTAPFPRPSPRTLVLLAGLAAIALGCSVLAGWALDIATLKSVVPGMATMKPNNAVGMLLCGIALALISRGRAVAIRLPVGAIGLALIALGGMTLAQDLAGLDFGIDRRLFAVAADTGELSRAGRMSPTSSFCYLLMGSSLLVASRPVLTRLASTVLFALGASVVVIGALGLSGHISAWASSSRLWTYAGMAVHTAAGFVVLGSGLLAFVHAEHPLKWSLNRLITIGFALGVISLAAATMVTYRSTARLQAEAASISQVQEILREIEEVESRVTALESSQRGYIITGDERLLERREATVAALREHFAAARRLAAENIAGQRRLDEAEPLIARRIEFEEQTIRVRRDSGFAPARQLIASGTGVRLTASIGQIFDALEKEEYALLQQRHRQSGAATTATFLLMPLGVFLSVVIFLLGLFLLNAGAGQQLSTEEAMRASETKYRQLVDQASDGILVLDAAGVFLFANPRACELLGYRDNELLGLENWVIYIESERHVPSERRRQAKTGTLLMRYERMVLRKDGTTFPAEFSSRLLDSGDYQVIFHDITERRRAAQALVAERTLLRTLIDAMPDVVFTRDTSGRFTMCNVAGFTHNGFASEKEILGKTPFDLYPRELAEQLHADDRRAFAGESILDREEVVPDAAGNRRWRLTIKVPLRDASGNIAGMVGVSRDITERKEHEERIARLNRIKAVLSGINSAIVRIRDRDELFKEACRIAAMHGAFRIACIGMRDASGEIHPQAWAGEGSEFFEELMRDSRGPQVNPRGAASLAIAEQRTIINNDITQNPELDRIRREAVARGCKSVIGLPLYVEGKISGVFTMYAVEKNAFDDEEVKLLEELAGDVSFALTFIAQQEKVDYLAYYDTLTGLPNRSLFFDRLEQQLARANREKSGAGMVLVDVDRFRRVNDTLGRQAGDALLKAIAERIKASVRAQDTVARVSANTFAIALSGTWRAEGLARFIETGTREVFNRPYWIGGEELRVSGTAGIAVFPDDAQLPETLVANAEAALLSAKQQNVPLMYYGPEMNAKAAESLRMETRLRRALERQELVLWYQPKVDVNTGKLTGFEALMRWNDPDLGMIAPGRFIPLMEQTGLILQAGNWALSQVARDCARWRDNAAAAPRIAVNVSPLQLREKDFVARVTDAADAIEKSGGFLDLEITESVIMESVNVIIPKLQTVRGLGVRIYIDDFGTGYSSLAYIARLPIFALKIDRSFVVEMTQQEESRTIVNSVISLAHSLKLCVVAEGVETEDQARLLKELACNEIQGYLFGRPVPPDEVPGVMKKFG